VKACAIENYSFAHQLGHLMGLGHDKKNDDPVKPGNYKDGHGHTFIDKNGNWFHTIMAIPYGTHIKVKHENVDFSHSAFSVYTAYCPESQSLAPY
jgi:hypothetical protein